MDAVQRLRDRLARAGRARRGLRDGPEVAIVSYPKCGRTWLRVMIGTALCRQFGLAAADLLDTPALCRAAGLRPTDFVHDGAGGRAGIPWDRVDRDVSRFADRSVVLLVRDPRDVVVSSYFQATRRMAAYGGTLSEFVRDDCFGVRGVLASYRAWEDGRSLPRAFQLLRYEELHADPGAALRSVLGCMGLAACDAPVLAAAVRAGSFEQMRALERSGRFGGKLRPGDASDPESYKVRRGVVGGYRDYLAAADIAFVEAAMEAAGRPFGYGAAAAAEPA